MIIVAWILGTPLFSTAEVAGESTTDFNGIVSLMIFWGMLELGVAMIAVCLPTMRPMFKGMGVESMLRSLRSFMSLSEGSRATGASHGSDPKDSATHELNTIQKRTDVSITSSSSENDRKYP